VNSLMKSIHTFMYLVNTIIILKHLIIKSENKKVGKWVYRYVILNVRMDYYDGSIKFEFNDIS